MADTLEALIARQIEEREEEVRINSDTPPDRDLLYSVCYFATQLSVSRLTMLREGTNLAFAQAFVFYVDELSIGIERLGGPMHPATDVLVAIHDHESDFANVLLDLMISGEF